ncbi:MAG: DUF1800 domain-containing protein [Halioglobus sp.]|nr:DUF1800 domain-containing protein [Halioglobus sp.]
MKLLKSISPGVFLLLALSACGGSSGGSTSIPPPPPPPPAPISESEAYQFLNQASFGATPAAATELRDIRIENWIDQQIAVPASLQLPHLRSLPAPGFDAERQADRIDIWFRNSLNGEDQLRQRVAFALSEILVVSQSGALVNYPYALADYFDMLVRDAFGNYRQLIEDVTLHPAMGIYLSMLGNEKPDALRNIRPDENYARELMQLFSIGLVELNIDGTARLDNDGLPIPTYDQATIEAFAHVYTGWNFAGAVAFHLARPNANNQVLPMQLYGDFHDNGEKHLLNGAVLPAGQGGEADLAAALDNIFAHPNVGPFISIRLIHRLVTSNPSPGYVSRVASVFNDNGSGVRGDLAAVVRAILLDPEARPALPMEIDGKVKEPLLRLTQLWRAYDAQSASGRYYFFAASTFFGQGPLQAPSVFNFFTPFYAPPGEIRDSSLLAPELQIATEYQNTLLTNYFLFQAIGLTSANNELEDDSVFIDIGDELAIADDADALIDMVAAKLLAGEISTTLRNEIAGMLALIPTDDAAIRAGEVIYFIVSSPEYAYQH